MVKILSDFSVVSVVKYLIVVQVYLGEVMYIAIGSDHAGFDFKKVVKDYLKKLGHRVTDFGTFSEESCDYPDIGLRVADAVSTGKFNRGVLFCNSGVGMSIVANKVPKIRAALCLDKKMAKLLCLSQGMSDLKEIKQIVKMWLESTFDGGRHLRRINKITKLEQKYMKSK